MWTYILLAFCAVSLAPELVLGDHAINEYPNPMKNHEACKRPKKSYLCDPDEILDRLDANQLDRELELLFNQTQCKCSQPRQCGGDRRGFRMGIALMEKMKMPEEETDENAQESDRQYALLKKKIHHAQLFAYYLLTQWDLGRCGDDMVLIYSKNDNVLFTFTGELTQSYLPPSKLAFITLEEKGRVARGDIMGGLRNIVQKYRDTINGK